MLDYSADVVVKICFHLSINCVQGHTHSPLPLVIKGSSLKHNCWSKKRSRCDILSVPILCLSLRTPSADAPDVGNLLYQKPYVRIPPYLVGMVLGYALYRLKDRQFTINRVRHHISTYICIATLHLDNFCNLSQSVYFYIF